MCLVPHVSSLLHVEKSFCPFPKLCELEKYVKINLLSLIMYVMVLTQQYMSYSFHAVFVTAD